jgi:CPA2 family monovalent cation:H+ antiporter-2
MSSLELTLLYLLAAVLGVVGVPLARLPPMLGYLLAGVLMGRTRWPGRGQDSEACATWPSSAWCS